MTVYPGEISQRSLVTTNGTVYVEHTVNPNASGDTALICIPAGTLKGASMLCAHGHSGSEATINNPQMVTTRDGALDRGWIVASSRAHSNAWASDVALADYKRVQDWVEANVATITKRFLHGQSMGGLTMLVALSKGTIPGVTAVASIDGATSLAYAYAKASYKPAITAAYGIASDGSDYAAKTAGHDANLLTPSTFDGKKIYLEASSGDDTIARASNSDVFFANMNGHPNPFTYEKSATGTHVQPANYFPEDVLAFFENAAGFTPAPVGLGYLSVKNIWMVTADGSWQVYRPSVYA